MYTLTKMTKKKQPFHWECKHNKAFKKLKDKFILASIIVSFYPKKKIILKTNASDQGLGSYLSQADEKKQLHLVAY